MSEIMFLAAEAPQYKFGFVVDQPNAVSACLFYLCMGILVWVGVSRARAGLPLPEIKRIPGLEAFDEAVGRATEMGRPVHMTNYDEGIGTEDTFAYWSYMAYVAKLCAQYDTRLIVTDSSYLCNAVHQDIVRQAYLEAGRPDAFNPDDIRYISGTQFAWAMNINGIIAREKPAAQFLIGYFYAEALLIAEAGALIESIQVAATIATTQIPFFIATCDYVMIGEEMYAGAAWLSRDPIIMGSVVSQDIFRIVIFVAVILGALLETFAPGHNFIKTFCNF